MIALDISTLAVPVVSAMLSAACAAVGVYVAIIKRLSVLETKMDVLSANVDKHNRVIERTYRLETDVATAWKRHDELAERVDRLEDARMEG
nr:MAG TPA: hemolysin [Caudoviricetes sp.]